MSITTRRPQRLGGANFHSGSPNTGELQYTRGGALRFTVFSGGLITAGSGQGAFINLSGGHVAVFSGGGRLNTIIPHQAISGVAAFFYDSAIIARSGVATCPESGRGVVGVMPANTFNGPNTLMGPLPIPVDCPFNSGLSVSCPSGTAGFTISYTPEVPPTYGE